MITQEFLKSKSMHLVIIVLVLINAVVLGWEALPQYSHGYMPLLRRIDVLVMTLLVIEITVRIAVFRRNFFSHSWNGFDLVVVTLSMVGLLHHDAFMQSLRVFLLFRVVEFSPTMKMLATALVKSFKRIFTSIVMLFLIFYTFALAGHYIYSHKAPDYFGSLDTSFLTLFQIMVFDSFGDVVGSMLKAYAASWIFVLLFLFLTAFSFINLIMGIVVNAIDDATKSELRQKTQEHQELVSEELSHIKKHVEAITRHHRIDVSK